jgi:hypothetical protein
MNISELISFLNELENRSIFYELKKHCPDSVMVCVAVPGQRWEIEFMEDGEIRIEKFLSNGDIFGKVEIETLFKEHSD